VLRFDDAVHRADFNALGRVEVTHTFNTGVRVNDIDVTVGDGIGGALGKTSAAGDTIFIDLKSHVTFSPFLL